MTEGDGNDEIGRGTRPTSPLRQRLRRGKAPKAPLNFPRDKQDYGGARPTSPRLRGARGEDDSLCHSLEKGNPERGKPEGHGARMIESAGSKIQRSEFLFMRE